MSNFPYNSALEKDEHRKENNAKAVDLYGWDSTSLNWVRVNVGSDGVLGNHLSGFNLCFIDTSGSVAYLVMENSIGDWLIKRIDDSSGAITYANNINNPGYTTTTARANESSLTYNLPSVIF